MRRSKASREAEDARMRQKFSRKDRPMKITHFQEAEPLKDRRLLITQFDDAEPVKVSEPEVVPVPGSRTRKSIWTDHDEFREQTFSFPHLRQGKKGLL